MGVWGWGFWVWGLGHWPQTPTPNPQSPIPNPQLYPKITLNPFIFFILIIIYIYEFFNIMSNIDRYLHLKILLRYAYNHYFI